VFEKSALKNGNVRSHEIRRQELSSAQRMSRATPCCGTVS